MYPNAKQEVPLKRILKSPLHEGINVDIWIEDIRLIIEVHGIQHEKASSFGADKLEAQRKLNRQLNRDSKLKNLCSLHNLHYLEYWHNEEYSPITIFNRIQAVIQEQQ